MHRIRLNTWDSGSDQTQNQLRVDYSSMLENPELDQAQDQLLVDYFGLLVDYSGSD